MNESVDEEKEGLVGSSNSGSILPSGRLYPSVLPTRSSPISQRRLGKYASVTNDDDFSEQDTDRDGDPYARIDNIRRRQASASQSGSMLSCIWAVLLCFTVVILFGLVVWHNGTRWHRGGEGSSTGNAANQGDASDFSKISPKNYQVHYDPNAAL